MAEKARKSSLIGNCRIEVIPNPHDTEIFKPAEKNNIRRELGLPNDKFLILFGAANVTDKRKGFVYLMQALEEIIKTRPEISQSFGLITFGKSGVIENFPVMLFPQAYLKDDQSVAMLYQAADMFITPTIEDNLPTTVMESLGCGTPVVAFNTGGIPDMIEHKVNGYLAEQKNIQDLISGILWVETHPEIDKIKANCRRKALENFALNVVAEKHLNLYRSLIK
jgi:glycosyltransferase involved in cell wall biosynthesis